MKISSCWGSNEGGGGGRDDQAVRNFQIDLARVLRTIFDSSRDVYIQLIGNVELIAIQGSLLTISFDVEHYNSEIILPVIQDLYSTRNGAIELMSVNVSWRRDLIMCSGDGCTQSRF